MTQMSPERWHPLTPLAVAVLLVALAYGLAPVWAAAAALTLALGVAWAAGSASGARVSWLALAVGVPAFLVLALMNGVVAPSESAAVVRWGGMRVAPTALAPAALVALRLAAAVAALGWVIVTVPPRRLARALAARGAPGWAVYVLVASFEAVPQARRRALEVLEAQRCRGLTVRGGVLGRARALLPLAGPLVVSLVTESEERALALDARGFRPGRARGALVPLDDPRGERLVRLALWVMAAALLLWRPAVWLAALVR